MGRIVLFLIGLILAALIGGAIYLIAVDVPIETEMRERVLDDDRFPRP